LHLLSLPMPHYPFKPFSLPPFLFFFTDTATTEIYTLSLHDALPICPRPQEMGSRPARPRPARPGDLRRTPLQRQAGASRRSARRSEEHTSELQSLTNLVCRLLLEKKKNNTTQRTAQSYH